MSNKRNEVTREDLVIDSVLENLELVNSQIKIGLERLAEARNSDGKLDIDAEIAEDRRAAIAQKQAETVIKTLLFNKKRVKNLISYNKA